MRRGRTATTAGQTRGQIIDAVSIRDRPAEIEDRAIPGHWEGDLLSSCRNSHIATLVERSSRYLMLVKVPGKDSDSVVSALIARVQHLFAERYGLTDLGSGDRTGISSQVHGRDRCQPLLL